MSFQRYVGIDLAWSDGTPDRVANETGVAMIGPTGEVLAAGWTCGVVDTIGWLDRHLGTGPALLFVDAPLVVSNPTGQRLCERQVGQRYGRWLVSANSTNLGSTRLAGVDLLARLEARGWRYHDGRDGPPPAGRWLSECYPYTTLVGVPELGYCAAGRRPRYKRQPRAMPAAQWRPVRAQACAALIARLASLHCADPPLLLGTHPLTRALLDRPTPRSDREYKHREDLVDAVICAWTAAYWCRHGLDRCQALGVVGDSRRQATIIAPAVAGQRIGKVA